MVITVRWTNSARAAAQSARRRRSGSTCCAFRSDEPCTVVGPVTAVARRRLECTLRPFLQAGVDESSMVIIWLFLRERCPFGPVDVEIELPIALSATRAVRGTKQVVLLENPASRAPHVCRVYPQAAASPTGSSKLVRMRWLRTALRGPWALAPQVLPLPQGMSRNRTIQAGWNLNQAGALRLTRTWPGYRLIGVAAHSKASSPHQPSVKPGEFHEHDLVLSLDMDPRGYAGSWLVLRHPRLHGCDATH